MTITWKTVQSQVRPTQAPSPNEILKAFDNLNVFEGRQKQLEEEGRIERQEHADAFDRMQGLASLEDMRIRQGNDRTRLGFASDENARNISKEAREVLEAEAVKEDRIKQNKLYELTLDNKEREKRNNTITDANTAKKADTKGKYTDFLSSIPAELEIGRLKDIVRNYISIQGLDNAAADEMMTMADRRETSESRASKAQAEVNAARQIVTDKENFLKNQALRKNSMASNKTKKIKDAATYFSKNASIPDGINNITDSTGDFGGFDKDDRNNVMDKFLQLQREYGNINQEEANKLFTDNTVDGKFFMESFEKMFLNIVQNKKYRQSTVGDVDPMPKRQETTADRYFRGLAKRHPKLTVDMLDGLKASVVSKNGQRIDSARAEAMIKQLVSTIGS